MVLKRPAGVSPECKPASPDASSPAHVEVLLPEVQQGYKPEWFDQPDEKAQLTNYLVTAAKLVNDEDLQSDPPLRDPARISKQEFHDALMDCLADPVAAVGAGRPRKVKAELDTYFGVKEGPEAAGHHHAGLRFNNQKHAFLPFKLAMRQRHGIATHWSTSHTEFFSIVRYLHKTTTHKKSVDRDPLIWTHDGRKLNKFVECQQPYQSKGWKTRRETSISEPITAKKEKKERFTHLDFKALVLEEKLSTPSGVLAYFQDKGSGEMMLWVSARQRKLKELIKEAVEWGAAAEKAKLEQENEWQLIERLAREGSCACGESGCMWWAMAKEFFDNNPGIDKERLAASIRNVIMFGPSKERPVPLITGARNCAKSTVTDPIIKVFGKEHVLGKPKLGAPNGAYGELAEDHIRVIYWDDYRPVEYAAMPKDNPTVPVTDFLAMFQGQAFKPQVSQSFNNGHLAVVWKKGVVMTAKAKGLWEPMGNVTPEEITHMKARVDIFPATHVVGTNPADFQTSPACPNPWCRWVVTDSMAYASRQAPRCLGGLGKKLQPLALPSLAAQTASAAGGLSDDMKAKIEAKRCQAKKRKLEKEGVEVANATGAEEAFAQEYLDFDEVDELCRGSGMDSP